MTRRRLWSRLLVVGAAITVAAAITPPASGGNSQGASPRLQGDPHAVTDLDARKGSKAPSGRQIALARGKTVRWNRFGTPQVLAAGGGYLATGLSSDPVAAARQWLAGNAALLGIDGADVAGLELLSSAPLGAGRAVLFRQRFGGLQAGHDGLVVVGVVGGKVAYVSSSLAAGDLVGSASLSPAEAFQRAAASVGRSVGDATEVGREGDWTTLRVEGLAAPQRVRLVALPLPGAGAVPAYEAIVLDNAGAELLGVSVFVDARSGAVMLRDSLVDDAGEPSWEVFPASPPQDYSSADTRQLWCWTDAAGCDLALDPSSPDLEWDANVGTGPSFTTDGNNAKSVHNWFSNDTRTVGTETATPRPGRDYAYPWANQWFEQRCNPDTTFTSPQRNDIDAARANLFAMHNRMHDWSYHLGFTEATWNLQKDNFGRRGLGNDPEQGNAQAGGVVGGPPQFLSRDNANQFTPADGLAPITNMYLWQPIAAGFYAPCVDGDFDMSVIAHEYTHAISNRMVAGPNTGLSQSHGGAMGESWSDLDAIEILNEYGLVPIAGENPYAVGPYVTGDKRAGIRNYGMNASPLNFSNFGYDFVCNQPTCPVLTQVHADGEIWSATNFAIRQAMIARYGAGTAALQAQCADGLVAVAACPGNRRWIQLVFDAFLLLPTGSPTMLDARDAMLAADRIRFGGANQDLLWDTFAGRGFGQDASAAGPNDADPVPGFASPTANEATLSFEPVSDGAPVAGARLFVGRFEARTTPVADTDPATALDASLPLVAGTYELLAQAPGHGTTRVSVELKPGMVKRLQVEMPANHASAARGATATGDGINIDKLIDDTEATNWASLDAPVAGRQVTVRLDPGKPWHQVARVQVSAELRTRIPADPGGDTAAQSRFSALRQFQILTCQARQGVDCTQDSQFSVLFTSAPDVFPSVAPRPRVPELLMKSFTVPKTNATHVRLRVLTNQCTGAPDYQGDQDDDPLNVTDCEDGSIQDTIVRAAELQVFGR
jgi:extracellular elastinolytic metalloproteinase